jgi:hypothetical protein
VAGHRQRMVRVPRATSAALEMRQVSPIPARPPAARVLPSTLTDLFPLFVLGFFLLYSNHLFTIVDAEALNLSREAQPIHVLWAATLSGAQAHPPVYDFLLHFWLLLTRGAFDWLRVPSIVFYLVGLWMLSRAAQRTGGENCATVSALLGALWPYGFHFGRLATPYALAFLFVCGMTWAYLSYCDLPSTAAWIVVCLFALALVYTNYFGWALVVLLGTDDWLRHRTQAADAGRRLLISAIALCGAYAPLWRVLLNELAQIAHGGSPLGSLMVNAGFNVYALLVGDSVAPWFWRFGIPGGLAVASCLALAFLSTKGPARRFLVFSVVLIALMATLGILSTERLLLVAPWVLLPLAAALVKPNQPRRIRALAGLLLVVAGIGWYGTYSRQYYASQRFLQPWPAIAAEAAGDLGHGAGVIGNNPSFFFYLTYALKVPPAAGVPWRFMGMLPREVQSKNIWAPEEWIAAGRPIRPQMLWIRGMPGPDEGTPMGAAADWLDHACGDRSIHFLRRDPSYSLKQRYLPEPGDLVWQVETHEYDCSQAAKAPAAASGRQ